MTALVILLALVIFAVTSTMNILRHDRPKAAPASHAGWGDPRLPSRPYSAGV